MEFTFLLLRYDADVEVARPTKDPVLHLCFVSAGHASKFSIPFLPNFQAMMWRQSRSKMLSDKIWRRETKNDISCALFIHGAIAVNSETISFSSVRCSLKVRVHVWVVEYFCQPFLFLPGYFFLSWTWCWQIWKTKLCSFVLPVCVLCKRPLCVIFIPRWKKLSCLIWSFKPDKQGHSCAAPGFLICHYNSAPGRNLHRNSLDMPLDNFKATFRLESWDVFTKLSLWWWNRGSWAQCKYNLLIMKNK